MKEIVITETWSNGKQTAKKIRRISRWIKVKQAYDVTPRHRLYDFCTDDNGYHPYQDGFNPENGTYLDYFKFRDRKYALEDFYRLGSMWLPFSMMWEEKDGLHWIGGCEMSGNIFHSLLIEVDEYGEHVRVYEEV